MSILPVILAGGRGIGLWPISTVDIPKQFVKIAEREYSLLQDTVLRALQVMGKTSYLSQDLANLYSDKQVAESDEEYLKMYNPPDDSILQYVSDSSEEKLFVILGGDEYRYLITHQMNEIGVPGHLYDIILEPSCKNTTPSAAIGAMYAKTKGFNQIWILPSDHCIENIDKLSEDFNKIIPHVDDKNIILLGITPTDPNMDYGYISTHNADKNSPNPIAIHSFKEKPDQDTANQYYQSGEYLWNSGMIFANTEYFLGIFEKLLPDTHQICESSWHKNVKQFGYINIGSDFNNIIPNSIDYEILEKFKPIYVMKSSEIRWSDVGNLSNLPVLVKDSNNNKLFGNIYPSNTSNSTIYSNSQDVQIVTHQVSDILIYSHNNTVLVASADANIKEIQAEMYYHSSTSKKQFRPWGYYKVLSRNENSLVKELTIMKNSKISKQKHEHRNEYWFIKSGHGIVEIDGESIKTTPRQTVTVPAGAIHRVENISKYVKLVIIEIQTGTILTEADIIRFEDDYGRIK